MHLITIKQLFSSATQILLSLPLTLDGPFFFIVRSLDGSRYLVLSSSEVSTTKIIFSIFQFGCGVEKHLF